MTHSVRTHGHLLKDTPWSPQRPAAATPGQGRWQPHSEVKPFDPEIPAVSLSQPLGTPLTSPTRPCLEAGERSWHSPELGGALLGRRTGHRHFLPWDDKPTTRRDTPLSACSLSLILFLPLASFSVELFAVHQQFMETGVWGGKRRDGSSQMPCPGPSQ